MEVLVLVDFEGQLGDELKMVAGDIIQKVQPGPEEGWLQGELDGRVGLFPQHFVQEIPASLRADGTQRYPRSLRSAHAVKKSATAKQRWCRVTFPYVPAKEDELELCPGELVQILKEIEDGWWLGEKGGQLGAFPSNFVQELSGTSSDAFFLVPKGAAAKQRPKMTNETFLLNETEKLESPSEKAASPPLPPTQETPKARPSQETAPGDTPRYCRAMFDYEPEHEDELPLRKGDLILLLNKETVDMGWWEGENRGKKGLFPDNFVMPLTHLEPGIRTKVPVRRKEAAKGVKKTLQGSKGEMRPLGDLKDCKEQKKMEAPKPNLLPPPPPPVKKAAPPPPPVVPTKAKPAPSVPQKSSNIPVSCTATPGGKAKSKETENNTFDAVVVPGAKLTHPTANRPKMPGKRPPSQLIPGSLVVEKEPISSSAEKPKSSEQVKVPSLSKRAESPIPVSKDPSSKEPLASLEDFKAELRELRTLMDLMRDQHRKDMEELKAEMSQEQTKRAALQAEIEWLKQTLPNPGLVDQGWKKPGAVEPAAFGVSSLAQGTPSKVSTKE